MQKTKAELFGDCEIYSTLGRMRSMEDTIRFEQVKKVYRMGEYDIEALAGVDFTIKKGCGLWEGSQHLQPEGNGGLQAV